MLFLTLKLASPPAPNITFLLSPALKIRLFISFFVGFTTLDSSLAFFVLRKLWMGVSKDEKSILKIKGGR